MSEEWRPVVGYEHHYEVSSLGRVRRILAIRGATVGRILNQKLPNSTNDYCRVQLCKNDVKRTFGVHVLVAEAFHGKRPRGKLPNHKDLVKTNNQENNLEWLTRRQNVHHALRLGKVPGKPMPGVANGRALLSEQQVILIRKFKGVIGQRELAVLCGVCKSTIQFIHQGKHWRHVIVPIQGKSGRKLSPEWPEDLRVREYPEVANALSPVS